MPGLDAILLARNEEINQWLNENPLVLGGGALVLGLVLLGFGLKDVLTGRAHDKWGNEMQGGMANVMGIVRLVAGVGVAGFGLFKIAQAFL
ncbi:MAG: hypothetical protein MUF06_14680 [Pirellulaceae bacterium]|jgi:hypothetical protein|nr:hypothetical protein [Pirellulaceae bacterium]